MKNVTELELRKQIFLIISKNPGLNISNIAEILNITTAHTIYHLGYLQKHNLISINKDEGFTRCYVKGEVGREDKKKLSILRKELPLKIVLFIIEKPGSKHKDLIKNFDIAKSTLSYHLKNLMKKGIITIDVINNEAGYVVVDEKEIVSLLIKYKPSKIASGFNETWVNFTARK